MRPALFLDRDGVINVDHGYVSKAENFEFIPGIFDLVKTANQAGYIVVVVTNQAGIGRGFYTEQDFHQLMNWVCEQFKQRGAHIDAVYYSPFHPVHGIGQYLRESECRKPAPGMILKAQKEHSIDLNRSILIGDKISDMQAGECAGVGTLIMFRAETHGCGYLNAPDLDHVKPYLIDHPTS